MIIGLKVLRDLKYDKLINYMSLWIWTINEAYNESFA